MGASRIFSTCVHPKKMLQLDCKLKSRRPGALLGGGGELRVFRPPPRGSKGGIKMNTVKKRDVCIEKFLNY
jgi:hypothetical protein